MTEIDITRGEYSREHLRFVENRTINRPGTRYNLISRVPVVIMTNNIQEVEKFLLLRRMRGKKSCFIIKTPWTLEEEGRLRKIGEYYRYLTKEYPQIRINFLCNTEKELKMLGVESLDGILCNSNCFLDEKTFKIIPCEKIYDAIYNARMCRFKRHHLAASVKNLALTNSCGERNEEADYFRLTEKKLPQAKWLNYGNGQYKNYQPGELALLLNQSRVGLCLSEKEGAMYASAEYLLCGIPVVSTKSIGGRDIFFEEEFARIVEDTPEAVARGVDEMKDCRVSPRYIRERTLAKMKEHRARFVGLVQDIYHEEGIRRDFQKEFQENFFNRYLKWQNIRDIEINRSPISFFIRRLKGFKQKVLFSSDVSTSR